MSWEKNKNKSAIAILRVSSRQQEGNHSHALQEEKISKYCLENGLEIVETRKIVESAKCSEDRKKYSEAIQYALKNKILHVLFYMIDREARNLTDTEANERWALSGKIVFHYVNENKVLHKDSLASDLFMRDISAVQNKNFSRVLSAKVIDVMRKKAENGWYPGNHPSLGYANQKMRDSFGRELKRGTTIVPDPNVKNVNLVRREFALRAAGFTLDQIREKILEEGLVERSRIKKYSRFGIEARLKNSFYWGSFTWQGVEYRGKHELIIDRHTLDAVKASFRVKGNRRRAVDQVGVFSGGWLRCGHTSCGLQIAYDPKAKKIKSTGELRHYPYYRCSNSRKLHGKLKYVSESSIWQQFQVAADRVNLSRELAQRIADALNSLNGQAKSAITREIQDFQGKLDDLNKKRNRLFDLFAAERIREDEFRHQSDRIEVESKELTQALERSQLAISDAWAITAQRVFELAINAKSIWESGSPQERLEYLKEVCSNQVLDGATVRIELKKPYVTIAEMNEKSDWRLQQDSNLRPSA